MRTQPATTTITRAVTVAAGVFAPGHLGELTQYLSFELVDDILEQTRTVQRRLRDLPSRVGVYFVPEARALEEFYQMVPSFCFSRWSMMVTAS